MTTSCTTMQGSLLTGVSTGAIAGAAGGYYGDKGGDKQKTAGKGALIGAAIGGLTSYLIHKGLKSREAEVRRKTIFDLDKHGVSRPSGFQVKGHHGITMPLVESEYIKERVTSDGKKLIEGHRVWKIREDAQFVPAPSKKPIQNGQ